MLIENCNLPAPLDTLLIVGSNLYGTNTETSDIDRRGFFLEPVEYLLGLKTFKSWESPTEDTVIWGFQHYFRMLMGGSPNVLETLFVDPAKQTGFSGLWQAGPIFNFLRTQRQSFVTIKAVKNMQAFAESEYQAFIKAAQQDIPVKDLPWKRAAHALRLQFQAQEMCLSEEIFYPSEYAYTLREIRRGDFGYEDFITTYLCICKNVYEARDTSFMRDDVDPEAMKRMYMQCIEPRLKEAYGW